MRVAVFGHGAVGSKLAAQLASSGDGALRLAGEARESGAPKIEAARVEATRIEVPRIARIEVPRIAASKTEGPEIAAFRIAASKIEVPEIEVSRIEVPEIEVIMVPNRGSGGDQPEIPACDVGVLALPAGLHGAVARALIRQGADVVSIGDAAADVRALRSLHEEAVERGRRVVIGAGFAPGLTCVLARHGAGLFDELTEIHVAKHGTGGPACARQHHAALKRPAWDYREGGWLRRPGGSGRELVWFPSPVEGADCYRAELADALLLVPAFPGVKRVSARVAATRRDRFTSWLPMLTPPHPEGGVGAVRVEIWGVLAGQHTARVFGVSALPSRAAAMVAAHAVRSMATQRWSPGAGGLAEFADPASFLPALVEQGIKIETFEGRNAYE